MMSDELDLLEGLKSTPSTRINWSFLLTNALYQFNRALLSKNHDLLNDILDFVESLIVNDLGEDYYRKVEDYKDRVMRQYLLNNPSNTEEEFFVNNALMMKVVKHRFRLLMKAIHGAGFTFHRYIDES